MKVADTVVPKVWQLWYSSSVVECVHDDTV